MIKKQNYLKHAIVLFLLLLLMQPGRTWAGYENVEFSSLTNHDGLTNSQVGAILKDTRGYIWFEYNCRWSELGKLCSCIHKHSFW